MKAELRRRGCSERSGKGSHVRFTSPCGKCHATVSGHDGDEVRRGLLAEIERTMKPCFGEGWLR